MFHKLQLERFVSNSGLLTVIQRANVISKNTFWICRCACDGMYFVALGKAIKSGAIQSCGCLKREMNQRKAAIMSEKNKLAPGEAAFNLLYLSYEWHAKERGYSFNLTREEFRLLTEGNCFYCGAEPYQKTGNKYCYGMYIYNGVDRKDNGPGYSLENCVSACGSCNKAKGKKSVEQFLAMCERVAENKCRVGELI